MFPFGDSLISPQEIAKEMKLKATYPSFESFLDYVLVAELRKPTAFVELEFELSLTLPKSQQLSSAFDQVISDNIPIPRKRRKDRDVFDN
jgi:hypothetical protein